MKKLKLVFCISIIALHFSLASGQSWKWGVEGIGPMKYDQYASPVATDKYGNAYITGEYQATILFGNDTLLATGNEAAYFVKFNSAGSVDWGTQLYGFGSCGNSIAVGQSVISEADTSEDIYVTGWFSGKNTIDTFSLAAGNGYNTDVFIIRFNAAGHVIWAKQSQVPSDNVSPLENSYGYGTSIATDKSGNIFVAGVFEDSISFGSFTLYSVYHNTDVFLVKYDSSGNVSWAQQSAIPSAKSTVFNYQCSVTTDNSGNAYITGSFNDTLSFGATSLINSTGNYAGFLVKYSSNGIMLWAKRTLNGSTNSYCYAFSVITDVEKNPYITGNIHDTVNFSSQVLYSYPFNSAFLAKI